MKIFHHNDLDGRCAAAIAWRYAENPRNLQNITTIEVDYKDDLGPFIEKILPDERVIIVDFSFCEKDMEMVLQKTGDIIWIDHHKSAIGRKYSVDLKGLRSNNYSGCELTWMYFCSNHPIPHAVELIGDMDTWKWIYGKETERFCEGLKLCILSSKKILSLSADSYVWDEVFKNINFVNDLIVKGIVAIECRDRLSEDYRKSFGFEVVFEGYKTYVLGFVGYGSKVFGDKMNEYPLCMNFAYDGKKWQIGIYSNTLDVSEIAVRHGGGGHKGAGGWVTSKFPWGENEDKNSFSKLDSDIRAVIDWLNNGNTADWLYEETKK